MAEAAWDGCSMGGHLGIRVAVGDRPPGEAQSAARRAANRIERWASRLTRFTDCSELSRLNAGASSPVRVGPTLGAALRWGAEAERRTAGVVDITLLDARLAAETGTASKPGNRRPDLADRWSLLDRGRRFIVHRPAGVRFDLDGVAKGWIADRALGLLDGWPGAVVDADGDIAIATSPEIEWRVAFEDPFDRSAAPLASLQIRSTGPWRERLGVATSGITVHRWQDRTGATGHHLIDPRTECPAITDLVQATVAAPSAAEAEALAKAAVILGSQEGALFLERSDASFALLVRHDGTTVELAGDAFRVAA
jgi:thiamine biosynthesis lipoprotein